MDPVNKAPAKKATVKKASTAVATEAVAKKAVAKKTPAAAKSAAKAEVTLEQILQAAPALETGQVQPLGDIVKQLHNAKLIGKNAVSTKLFKKFPDRFELTPAKQPNQVRHLPT